MKKFDIIAKTLFGFENILADELQALGASNIELLTRAVKYQGDMAMLYKSNLHLRTAIKILKPIATFEILNETELYESIKSIAWDQYMSADKTFAIDGIVSSEKFTHSQFVALKSKDAIVDQFREKTGARPSVEIEDPDVRINVHIADTTCTVSLDSSGKSLGKRGYKLEQTFAPLSEVLAAGMVILSGWDREREFIDPMCGSGTIPIEAALFAGNIAPGKFRSFTFEKWNDFDSALWKKIKAEAEQQEKPIKAIIKGFDIDRKAIRIELANAERAGVDKYITFDRIDFFKTKPETDNALVLMNPPYGERLEEREEMIPLYQEIGTHLKHSYDGADAWILSGNLEALKFIGLRPSKKIKLYNGPIECKFHKYELYRGSKKASKQENQQEMSQGNKKEKPGDQGSVVHRFKRGGGVS